VIHRFADSLARGELPVIRGDGSHTRDFTHVSDIVAATMLAAESEGLGGEVFNVGFGTRTTISELAGKLIRIMGLEGKVEPRYVEEDRGDFPHTQADNGKARRLLHWEPKVSLDDGLKSYVDWFRATNKVVQRIQ
jgi:UDP-N-acetylglucosamine 4-epimerase